MDTETYTIGRVWYLKAAPMIEWYFIDMLWLYPIETLIFWIIHLVIFKCKEKRQVLQKELNKVWIGPDLDYSHKIGRILGHGFIAFYHGPGIPLLYLLFFLQIAMFVVVEKALMVRIYKRFEHIDPYVRQYIIHVILFMLMFHYFRTIEILGSEEIFPSSHYETLGLKSGTLLYYYEPNENTYGDKIILAQGICYFLLALATTAFYAIIWWTHRRFCLSKVFGGCSLLTKANYSVLPLTTVRNRTLGYFPDTYRLEKTLKYRESLPSVETRVMGTQELQVRVDSSIKSHIGSQVEMKSEVNSGDEVNPEIRESISKPIYNIYKDSDVKANERKKVSSHDLELEDLEE